MGTIPLFEAVDLGISAECEKCKAYKNAKTPFMKTHGEGKTKILILSDCPTASDDNYGSPFSGDTGRYFEKQLDMLGYDLNSDFYIEHAISCKVKKEPSNTQIKCCRDRLFSIIEESKPKAIISLGTHANKVLFGDFLKNTGVATLDGLMIPYKDLNCWVFPLYHPSYALKNKWDTCISSQFRRSLESALKRCKKLPKFPKFNPEKKITSLYDFKDVVSFLNSLLKYKGPAAFDYETTGINYYQSGHKITSIAITKKDLTTHSFAIEHSESGFTKLQVKTIKKLLKKCFLKNKKIFKIAHNGPFEMGWSRVNLKSKINVKWCTMTTQHLINASPNSCGLKHQAFVRWGLHSYEKASGKWIDSGEGMYNKMFFQPLPEQLLYVGYDGYLTMKLFLEQKKEIPKWNQKFFNQGLISFEELKHNGMHIDIKHYEKSEKEIAKTVAKIEKKIMKSKEIKKHKKLTKKDFNIDSSAQIGELLYNTMGMEVKNRTETGKPATDGKTLLGIDHWIIKDILERRKLAKVSGTYISQFKRYNTNGKLHPTYALHIPRSLRSSSYEPKTLGSLNQVNSVKPHVGNTELSL